MGEAENFALGLWCDAPRLLHDRNRLAASPRSACVAPPAAARKTAPGELRRCRRPSCRVSSSRCAISARTISSARRSTATSKPVCLLTRQAAAALAQVARDLEPRGLVLKVFDCYRPARAVAHFVRWARNLADVARKAEFYPEVDKRNLFRDGYIAARSGHSRGSTIDLTLARRADGQARARHGHAVRLLQSALLAVRPAGERGGAGQPRAAGAGDARAAASCPTTRNGGTSRCAMSRSRQLFRFSGAVARAW